MTCHFDEDGKLFAALEGEILANKRRDAEVEAIWRALEDGEDEPS